mgnify:CR=1 FL=1
MDLTMLRQMYIDVTAKVNMSVGLSSTFVCLPERVDQSGGVIYSWHDCAEVRIMRVVMVRGRIGFLCIVVRIIGPRELAGKICVGCDLSLI